MDEELVMNFSVNDHSDVYKHLYDWMKKINEKDPSRYDVPEFLYVILQENSFLGFFDEIPEIENITYYKITREEWLKCQKDFLVYGNFFIDVETKTRVDPLEVTINFEVKETK